MKKYFLIFIILFCNLLTLSAQKIDSTDDDGPVVEVDYGYTKKDSTVAGRWYGIGNPAIPGDANSYLCELILTQTANGLVKGHFNYYFRDAYFSSRITGKFSREQANLTFRPIPILFHRTVQSTIGVDVPMTGFFMFKMTPADTSLTGFLQPTEKYKLLCPPINMRLFKMTPEEPTLKQRVDEFNKNPEARPKALLIAKEGSKKEAELNASKIKIQKTDLTLNTKQIETAEFAMAKRQDNVFQTLSLSDDSVTVALYDNGEYDHDRVSIFKDDKLLKYNQELQVRNPIEFKIALNKTEVVKLTLFAENLGDIPPNSALMIISDTKGHRYQVNVASDLQKNATVLLKYSEIQ